MTPELTMTVTMIVELTMTPELADNDCGTELIICGRGADYDLRLRQ